MSNAIGGGRISGSIEEIAMPAVAVAAVTPTNDTYPPAERLQRLTVEQYHRLFEIGVLKANANVELLEGIVVKKMTQLPPHASTVMRLNRYLSRLLQEAWELRSQLPITLSDSEPEPDFAIVVGPDNRYDKRHPKPSEVALVIEVADSSLLEDRRYKGSLYAAAKIPQFWIVYLPEAKIEVHTSPRAGRSRGYRSVAEFRKGDVVPLVLKGDPVAEIAVADWIR